jgi:hypothetical protein
VDATPAITLGYELHRLERDYQMGHISAGERRSGEKLAYEMWSKKIAAEEAGWLAATVPHGTLVWEVEDVTS